MTTGLTRRRALGASLATAGLLSGGWAGACRVTHAERAVPSRAPALPDHRRCRRSHRGLAASSRTPISPGAPSTSIRCRTGCSARRAWARPISASATWSTAAPPPNVAALLQPLDAYQAKAPVEAFDDIAAGSGLGDDDRRTSWSAFRCAPPPWHCSTTRRCWSSAASRHRPRHWRNWSSRRSS